MYAINAKQTLLDVNIAFYMYIHLYMHVCEVHTVDENRPTNVIHSQGGLVTWHSET